MSEVRFTYIPAHATHPVPSDGASGVDPHALLGWRPGRTAGEHTLSLGADMAAVAAGDAVIGTTTERSYALADLGLGLGQTYYWTVDEVNSAESPATWTGSLWSFTVAESLLVRRYGILPGCGILGNLGHLDGWV